MASQQIVQSGEQQVAIPVPLVDPRGEASDHRNSAQPQSLLQQLIDIDTNLLDVSGRLVGTRRALYVLKIALDTSTKQCSAYEKAFHEERQQGIAFAEAYAKLYAQYEGALDDLNTMSGKCLSLHRDLEDAQTAMLALESTTQRQERSSDVKDIPDAGKGRGFSQSDWDMVEHGIASEQLCARIRELENEKSDMMREHENEKFEMKREHENEKFEMMREHDDALTKAVNQQGGRAKRGRKAKQEVKPEPYSQ